MSDDRRFGILGGTFDPIHRGHLDVGTVAQAALGLTDVFFVPSNIPPHRPQPLASSHHRFAMTVLAVADRPGWMALDIELREATRSYTADTLRRFLESGFDPAQLHFIVGADAFLEIGTWKDYPDVLDLTHFAVVSRPGLSVTELTALMPSLSDRMRAPDRLSPARPTSIFLIDQPTADISSTAIRRACAHRESIAQMVTPAVQKYIEQQGLYEEPAPTGDIGAGIVGRPAGRLHGQD